MLPIPTKKTVLILGLALLMIPLSMDLTQSLFYRRNAPLLLEQGNGHWIEAHSHYIIGTLPADERKIFQRHFKLTEGLPTATFSMRAYSQADAYLDGALLVRSDPANWRNPAYGDLNGKLPPGEHTLEIVVTNHYAPALLQTHSSVPALNTDQDWLFTTDGETWFMTDYVGQKPPPDTSLAFPPPWHALMNWLPLGAVFTGGILLLCRLLQARFKDRFHLHLASATRWCTMAAWAALAVNNISKIPLHVGYDIKAHLDYILYLLNNHRIPLAADGWQMFQSPLYYISSSVWSFIVSLFTAQSSTLLISLRAIPLACGMIQVELSYRALKNVYPKQALTQALGVLVGGFLPMNLYISQVIGNEPMAGALISIAITYTLYLLQAKTQPTKLQLVLLGLVIGCSLLTKVTAIILLPATVSALIWTQKDNCSWKTTVTQTLLLTGVAMLVSGWYYARNWMLQGTPFIGGWEQSGSHAWWQNPGYRLPRDFVVFGASLTHPIFSATNGFWDSFYSTLWLDGSLSGIFDYAAKPPWNYDPMLSCTLLSLLPATLMIAGYMLGFSNKSPEGLMFCTLVVSIYIAALLYLYIQVPVYSTTKASYALGATPCFAVMFAAGFQRLLKKRWLGICASVFMLFWAVTAYSSFFVR